MAGASDDYTYQKPPQPGKVFYVRVEEDEVRYYRSSQSVLEKALEESGNDLARVEKTLSPLRLPIMRCCRKLGNLYRRLDSISLP
jgi:hypothetical protein